MFEGGLGEQEGQFQALHHQEPARRNKLTQANAKLEVPVLPGG